MTLEHRFDDTSTLRLVPLTRRWADEWFRVRNESWDWLSPWEATVPPGSGAAAPGFGKFVRVMNRLARRGEALPWVILLDSGARSDLVGQLTVTGITGGSSAWAQIGYWVAATQAGRGIAPLATAMAADHCWNELHLHRIEIVVRPENRPSIRVVEKLGFRYEGIRPKYLHINGDWRDHTVWALNREEVPEGGLVARADASRGRVTGE